MAIARYSVPASSGVDLYGTLGLGAVRVEYDGSTLAAAFTGTDTVPGGQISLGAAVEVTPQVAIFGELTHQTTFDDASIQGISVEYESTTLAAGVRFSF